ncbi:hypothetical protein DERF_002824 [Dermatophagoides farinae]|uniref:Uncharacterized protein n=1 Tax=Dermatophagoides farinae TaxID=6954 RepID=A0A922ICD2_DERFA|nr:hypothetical protein DERF_002824 [Dermatophagoides farinae]
MASSFAYGINVELNIAGMCKVFDCEYEDDDVGGGGGGGGGDWEFDGGSNVCDRICICNAESLPKTFPQNLHRCLLAGSSLPSLPLRKLSSSLLSVVERPFRRNEPPDIVFCNACSVCFCNNSNVFGSLNDAGSDESTLGGLIIGGNGASGFVSFRSSNDEMSLRVGFEFVIDSLSRSLLAACCCCCSLVDDESFRSDCDDGIGPPVNNGVNDSKKAFISGIEVAKDDGAVVVVDGIGDVIINSLAIGQCPDNTFNGLVAHSVAAHPIMIDADVEVRDVYDEEVIVDADLVEKFIKISLAKSTKIL